MDVGREAPGIRVEMVYASTLNFTGAAIYDFDCCVLAAPAAKALAAVQAELAKEGLGLKVWDCYRPLAAQRRLWAAMPDPKYVADPAKGSKHNRGAAVDATLVDARGRELAMPTPYDDFSPRAHRSHQKLPAQVKRNRERLERVMERHGFKGLATEWWHFDFRGWTAFPLRDDPVDCSAAPRREEAAPDATN